MTKPMTKSILAAGTLALAVTITRVAPALRSAVATAAPAPASPWVSPGDGDESLARASSLAGIGAAPRDDESDSGDGGEGDDGGDDDDSSES
jgi:hypothetical protein